LRPGALWQSRQLRVCQCVAPWGAQGWEFDFYDRVKESVNAGTDNGMMMIEAPMLTVCVAKHHHPRNGLSAKRRFPWRVVIVFRQQGTAKRRTHRRNGVVFEVMIKVKGWGCPWISEKIPLTSPWWVV